jgi:hypothetical protein
VKLSNKELEVIAKAAAVAAIEHFEKQQKLKVKEKQDRRLHNIKLLLKNYRGLVLHCKEIKDELIEIDSTSIQELDIDTITVESIESIKASREKSLAMILFVQGKMNAYKLSRSDEELKYFRVLEKKYLTSEKYSIKQIAESEHIERASVYRYLEKAIDDLPVIFFGVEAIEFKET